MRNGFRIYDAHTHIGTARHSGQTYTCDQLLRDMDRAGVDHSLVIPFPVVDNPRAAHDEIGRAVEAHRDRLTGAACLPAFLPEAEFRGEVRRAVERYGFRALKLQPQYQPVNVMSGRSAYVFETALEHRLPLVCHTGSGVPFALPALFMMPARGYPSLTFVLAHSGGTLLALEAIVAASFCPNVYLELSSLQPHQVGTVLEHIEPHRLMIGSDLPENLDTEIGKILGLNVSAEVRAAILWETAHRVFGPG
jgi:hypothetical protein